jgi:hypothetical protein
LAPAISAETLHFSFELSWCWPYASVVFHRRNELTRFDGPRKQVTLPDRAAGFEQLLTLGCCLDPFRNKL